MAALDHTNINQFVDRPTQGVAIYAKTGCKIAF